MNNQEKTIDVKPRDIVEINGAPFYIVAELKTDKYDYVELSNLNDATLLFAAKDGDLIIPISDEKLILALAKEMSAEAKDNAKILLEASKNARKLLFGKN